MVDGLKALSLILGWLPWEQVDLWKRIAEDTRKMEEEYPAHQCRRKRLTWVRRRLRRDRARYRRAMGLEAERQSEGGKTGGTRIV
jgi:hypothetical protein